MLLTDMLLLYIIGLLMVLCWLTRENRPYKKPSRRKRVKDTIPVPVGEPKKRYRAQTYPERNMTKGDNEV